MKTFKKCHFTGGTRNARGARDEIKSKAFCGVHVGADFIRFIMGHVSLLSL
jgi:hypothetical protein